LSEWNFRDKDDFGKTTNEEGASDCLGTFHICRKMDKIIPKTRPFHSFISENTVIRTDLYVNGENIAF
jgi:hypothetical protein